MATEPNRTEPSRTEPNRTEIIHDLENNFKQNNILKLKQIFPEVFCEDQIDFEKLKLVLGAENLADAGERYQLDWAGKTTAYLNLQSPTSRTLVPCKEESADFDGTQNVFIEAENLEALKILQKSYAGSVKMIYIDPPYNTGNDSFIYPDKFSESREEYARRVGDTDDAGYLKRDGVFQGAWRKNGKDSGHYHSNWLSMMLPRLHLAKTMLREDGVIFISIDDNEQAQLKLLCDEVFGAENFAGQITVVNNPRGRDYGGIAKMHEYLITYTKTLEAEINNLENRDKEFPFKDSLGGFELRELRNRNIAFHKENRPNLYYPFYVNENSELDNGLLEISLEPKSGFQAVYPKVSQGFHTVWRWGKEKAQQNLNVEIAARKMTDGGFMIVEKYRKTSQMARSVWAGKEDNSEKGTLLVKELFDGKKFFDFPKSEEMIRKIIQMGSNKDDLILDFFSGSGTTAHAVMQLNAEDGGSRRFICVQLPEETDEKSEARKAGFDTIAEIAKERIRRAGRQISDGLQDGSEIDTGFKVFKLAESGFKQWRQPGQADTEALQRELSLNIDSVLSETSSENLLYELMMRMGLKLTCKVSFSDDVYFVEDEDTGGLYAFLLERVDQGLIDAMLEKHPVKVAVLDRLFEGDDALKSNTVLQMKDAGVMFECV